MKRLLLCLLTAASVTSSYGAPHAQPPENPAVQSLIGRLIPQHVQHIICETIPAVDGKDVYEIETKNGKIILRGNSGVALASGLYHYLKEFCHCHVSWNGDQLNLPPTLPTVPQRIRVIAPVQTKFAYNYCTHGYTMVWWDWAQWERELDWLALHGINMALIIEGQEAVWQNTFTRFGYTQEQVRQWISSPIYLPWQFMQNMEGVLPPPQSLINKRVALGQKIVQRCRELGIRPVLQGYYGMVPTGFKQKYPDAKIVEQGAWAGDNRRPDMLHIADPRFTQIAAAFLEEQKKLFGECHYFAADPFHEGGRPADMKRGEVYKVIQEAILKFDPAAILVKQCWQTSNKEMFDAGDKAHSLALDLWCDYRPFWKNCKGYDGTPWLWCKVHNFGGNLGMERDLPKLAKDLNDAFTSPDRGKLAGIAFVPEGSHQNPVVYELFTEIGWRGAPKSMVPWIENYIHARYGKINSAASAAWKIMLGTNYSLTSGESPINTVIVAAPRIDPNIRGRTWSPGSQLRYDNITFSQAWLRLLEADPELGGSDAFRFDLADVSRQTLCNLSRPVYDQMVAAFQARDRAVFNLHAQRLLGIIRDLDTLTATRTDWLMGKWVADARAWGDTNDEKAYLDKCARLLPTTWIPYPHSNLADYANREWNGLLGEYYLKRWDMFITALQTDLTGKGKFKQGAFNKARCEFEVSWINGQSSLTTKPQGDTLVISKQLYAKYAPILADYAPKPGKLAKGEWNKDTLSKAQDFTWDISDKVKSPGVYAVTFQWNGGQSALTIDSTSLVINGDTVHTDDHPGWTGVENKHNNYYLKAISVPPNAVVELKIFGMKGASGNGSSGTIIVEQLK